MRLINTTTLKLEEFPPPFPTYAILSHTWDSNEATMADMPMINQARYKRKFAKIRRACSEASQVGLKYCWVDTCCIDKTSSAELSESINSMFEWYKQAAICYVFLSDLKPSVTREDDLEFAECRWFTRGWTLQELVAPGTLVFFDKTWSPRGSIRLRDRLYWPPQYRKPSYEYDLSARVSGITGISTGILRDLVGLRFTLAAEILSWASMRSTTRVEDQAYSLMGLLDVNMPLLYGEGQKAFLRLQEEILRRRGDLSLLAWEPVSPITDWYSAVLAKSPKEFSWCRGQHISQRAGRNLEIGITNRGLRLKAKLCIHVSSNSGRDSPDKDQSFGHYFLDLNLRVISHTEYERSIGGILGLETWPTGTGPNMSIGLHLHKCGPSLFCRDLVGSSRSLFARLDEISPTIHENVKTPIYLFSGSSINQVFREHPFLEELWSTGPMINGSNTLRKLLETKPKILDGSESLYRGRGIQYLYDKFRRLDIHFPPQEHMRLARVANGSLWDETQRTFISTKSNHTGWDAMVFHPQVPDRGVIMELEAVVLFIFFLKRKPELILTQPPQIVVLVNARAEEIGKFLNGAIDMDQDELLQEWPALSHKVQAVLDDSKLEELANPKQAIHLQLSQGLWRDNPLWQEAPDIVIFNNPSLRTEVAGMESKWNVEARMCLKPVPGNPAVKSTSIELFLEPTTVKPCGGPVLLGRLRGWISYLMS